MSAPRRPRPATVNTASLDENTLQTQVLELLELLGYRAVHHRPLRTRHGWRTGLSGAGSKGWVDIFAIRTRPDPGGRHRVVAIELKSRLGRLSPDQKIWIRLLAAAGIETHIWRAGVDSLEDITRVLR